MFINKRQLTYSNHKCYFSILIRVCREHKRFKPTGDKHLPLLTSRLCLLLWSSFVLLKSLFHRCFNTNLPVTTVDCKQFDFRNGFSVYENQPRTIIQ